MGRGGRRSWPGAFAVLAVVLLLTGGTGGRRPPEPADPPHHDGCTQTLYRTHGTRQLHSFTWVVNSSSIPPYLDRAGALRAIRRGTATMARARTPCPTRNVATPALPRAIYTGDTERQANIKPDATCFLPSDSDGVNVVSFGRLPADVVAVTCTYSYGGDIWQSDVMLNDKPGVFTLSPGDDDCSYSYDLQAVITHERGHSFGLAHVTESIESVDLTMSSALSTCDASARTLGLGDVIGLSRIY